jgi:hypothetical protein
MHTQSYPNVILKKYLETLGSYDKAALVHSLYFYRTVLTDEQCITLICILVSRRQYKIGPKSIIPVSTATFPEA